MQPKKKTGLAQAVLERDCPLNTGACIHPARKDVFAHKGRTDSDERQTSIARDAGVLPLQM
jgi:hypothetical protein